MTQAYNISQLANNLNTSGQLDATDGLVNAVPVANGGTGASTAANARTNLGLVIGTNVPSLTGTGASGTWAISVSGSSASTTGSSASTTGNAATATAPASGGSFITSLNISSQSVNYASTAGNGGVTSVNGSTGAVTVAAGVTSVNGQTGAVVTTTFGGIGSVVTAIYLANSPNTSSSVGRASNGYGAGTTVSGGSLAYDITGPYASGTFTGTYYGTYVTASLSGAGSGSANIQFPPNGSRPSVNYFYRPQSLDWLNFSQYASANTYVSYSTLSGSWRSMSSFSNTCYVDTCDFSRTATWGQATWVRYA